MIITPTEPNDENQNLPPGPSHLFLLRLWMPAQVKAEDQANWRGRLQDPVTGQALDFSGWTGLREAILDMMAD